LDTVKLIDDVLFNADGANRDNRLRRMLSISDIESIIEEQLITHVKINNN